MLPLLWWQMPGVLMTLLMSWCHSWQMGAVHQRLTQDMTGECIVTTLQPWPGDQASHAQSLFSCQMLSDQLFSWLSELLNILYWGILLRMSGVILKASQYLARLFQWSKWASQMDFQKFYNFHIFSHHRPHIKISKEPSSISWYPLWRW